LNDWELNKRWVIYVSQQLELRRRIDNRCLEVVRICKSYCNADAVPFMELVRNREQAEDQFDRISIWD
jgi:hypothetical protein